MHIDYIIKMAYLRQILHLVHLTCFSFILGNMINEYFFGKMKLENERNDRMFIMSRIVKQYLDQYKETYPAA